MKVMDRDGDIWESDEDGGWDLIHEDAHGYLPDLDTLGKIWGPLTELEDE
ncbi:hypothetical protein SEA_IBANTIK_7 [Streptomyces phage Ibantik]|uniref:Uncharacterized protein n=1 Tax=Streptomyces phage Ibantik TaxID=2182397 RepID=A0A2U8UNM0_9CAUD|nr:hypothetical protein QEH36_gp007 [Streptomyces phage Ibantik]AWN05232.1 hypothetical protein SEA_IBANTIK_7 [Streptomyces phage Ibantik]